MSEEFGMGNRISGPSAMGTNFSANYMQGCYHIQSAGLLGEEINEADSFQTIR